MKEKNPFDPLKLALPVIKRLHVRRLSTLACYDEWTGLYQLDDRVEAQKDTIAAVIRPPLKKKDPFKDHRVQETVKAIHRNAPVIAVEELNDPSKEIIIFENRVFNLQTGYLGPFSPDHK